MAPDFWAIICGATARVHTQDAGEVCIDYLLPELVGYLQQGSPADQRARVVHKHINAAELFDDLSHNGHGAAGTRKVGLEGFGPTSGTSDAIDHISGRRFAAVVVNADTRTTAGQG